MKRSPPAAAPDVDVDYRALAELRHRIRRFLTFSESEAREAGIEPQQHQVLLAVKGLPENLRPTIGVLAERLQLRHHTVVGLIDRLVTGKLAVRRPSSADRREILVIITPRGEELLRRLSLVHAAELRSVGPTLVRALDQILSAAHPAAESLAASKTP